MESVLFRYSDFFDNDGGFDRVKADFMALGDELIKEAKRIRSEISLFDTNEIDRIADLEKRTEQLNKTFREYNDARKQVENLNQTVAKSQRNNITLTNQQGKSLDQLNVELEQHRVALRVINAAQKAGELTETEAAEARGRLRLETRNLTQEIRRQEKAILDQNKLTRTEQKLQQATITLEKERATTIQEIRERLSALRLVASQVNITTEEGRAQVAAYNEEINELTDQLAANSDKFIQNKINVGNYEEAIRNALDGTEFFTTGIGGLDVVLGAVTAGLVANTEALERMEQNFGRAGKATANFIRNFRRLNGVLRASIIGTVLIAIAGIASAFSQGRAGAVRTEQVLKNITNTLSILGSVAADVGGAVIDIIGLIGNSFTTIGLRFDRFTARLELLAAQARNLIPGGEEIDTAPLEARIESLGNQLDEQLRQNGEDARDVFSNLFDVLGTIPDRLRAIGTSGAVINQAAIDAFVLGDNIKRAELNVVELQKAYDILQQRAGDSTISLNEQLEAANDSLEAGTALIEEQNKVREAQLALANSQAAAEVIAQQAGLEGAQRLIELADVRDAQGNRRRRSIEEEIEFAQELLAVSERTAVLQNNLSDDNLEQSQVALRELLQGQNELVLNEVQNAQIRREIQRDLFEQNLDLLIDFIDVEKQLSEEQVNNVANSFRDRLIEADRFNARFRENARRELDEFNKLAQANAQILRDQLQNDDLLDQLTDAQIQAIRDSLQQLEGIDLQLQFNEDGSFDVLNDGTALTLDNIVELNKELQALGLAEIPINRFRGFNIELNRGLKELQDQNEELRQQAILFDEINQNLTSDEGELDALDDLTDRLLKVGEALRNENLSDRERDELLKQLEDLEKERTAIAEVAEFERRRNRIDAINEELALVKAGSQREAELLRERLALEKQIRDADLDDTFESIKKNNEKIEEENKKAAEEARRILGLILDRVVEVGEKRVEEQEKVVERSEEQVERQERRAEQGLENTLAFEQRERARAEAELIAQQARLERLERIRGLYASYANYAQQGEGDNAIVRALRDFAILESITRSFGEGGAVDDKLPTDGIFRGRSHQGRKGGIPILVEGREGIFSAREMENLGKDNFYAIKRMAGLGVIGKNMFSQQGQDVMKYVPVPMGGGDPALVQEVREVKNAIKNKPDQQVDVPSVVDGVLKFTETVTKGRMKKRNHYRIKKPRL